MRAWGVTRHPSLGTAIIPCMENPKRSALIIIVPLALGLILVIIAAVAIVRTMNQPQAASLAPGEVILPPTDFVVATVALPTTDPALMVTSTLDLPTTTPEVPTLAAGQAGQAGDDNSGGGAAATLPANAPTLAPAGLGFVDEHDTVLTDTISIGQSKQNSLASAFDAHNYNFTGSAGQQVTITAEGSGATDLVLALYDASGRQIARADDSGGTLNPRIQASLPAAGIYTIRVTAWVIGAYALTLN